MPMHYPPLSDGTYRYGDPPRPLPSPVPGPDPHTPAAPARYGAPAHVGHPDPPGPPPHGGGPGPHVAAPPEPYPTGPPAARSGRPSAALIAVLVAVVAVVVGFIFFGPGSDRGGDTSGGPLLGPLTGQSDQSAEFAVRGRFTVVGSPTEPVSGTGVGCDLPPSMSDIGEDTPIALLADDATPLDADQLVYQGGDLSSCTFTFRFRGVPAGLPGYVVELPGRGQLPYTETELRAGIDITLGQ